MSDIKKLYLSTFFNGFSIISTVTLTLFLLSNNIGQSQIAFLFSALMITAAIFQIPTGGFADRFGCKKSVYIGMTIQAFSFLVLFFAHNFNGFLTAMVLSGLGNSLQSGAYSSLIHRILAEKNKAEDYAKIWGQSFAFFFLAIFIASPIGAFIYKQYPRLPFIFSFIAVIAGAISIYLIKNKDLPAHFSNQGNFLKIMKKGIKYTILHPKLIALSIIGASLMTVGSLINQNISQPYQLSIGNDVTGIGFVSSLVAVIGGILFYFSHHIIRKVNVIISLLFITIATTFCLIALGTNYYLSIGIFFILVYYAVQGFREPLLNTLIQKEAINEQRSTIVSTVIFLNTIIAGLLLPFWGKSIEIFGMRTTLIYLSLFTIIAGTIGIVIYSLGHKNSLRRQVTLSETI